MSQPRQRATHFSPVLAACAITIAACGDDGEAPPRAHAPAATNSNQAAPGPRAPGAPPPSSGAPDTEAAPATLPFDGGASDSEGVPANDAGANGYQPLVIPAGATVYYVDALAGNDANDGRTTSSAWRTAAKVSAADVKGGEYVLFQRGQTFDGSVRPQNSGAPSKPIVFSSFGSGARARIKGSFAAYSGFDVTDRQHLVVRDLDIAEFNGPGIHVDKAVDVLVYNVAIANTGADNDMSGIHGNDASYVTADHVTMSDVTGDAFGVWGGDHLRVVNSRISRVFGASADAIHIAYASDLEIRGNWLDLTVTNSGKGTMCICYDSRGVIADNVLIGGNYAVGLQSDDFVVENNWAEDNNHAPWSYTLAWGGDDAVNETKNVTIRNNVVVSGKIGLASFYNVGDGTKTNLQAYGNVFIDTQTDFTSWGATFVNSSFHDNVLFNTSEGTGPGLSVFANQIVGARPSNSRPSDVGRGAF
jgi:hypothetical protein